MARLLLLVLFMSSEKGPALKLLMSNHSAGWEKQGWGAAGFAPLQSTACRGDSSQTGWASLPAPSPGHCPQGAEELGFLMQKKQESSYFSPPKCSLCAASPYATGNPINPIQVLAVPKPHPPALTPPPATRSSKLLFENIFLCSVVLNPEGTLF